MTRHAHLFAAALSLGAALATQPGVASPPPPPPEPAPEFSGIGTFESRLAPTVKGDFIARAYEAGLRARLAEASGSNIKVKGSIAADGHGPLAHPEADLADGEFAGRWEFEAPDGGLPTRAWRNIDHSVEAGYAAERIGYCKGSRKACNAWFETGRYRSRAPRYSAGRRAYAEWTNRVMEEPCSPGAEYRPSMVPLQTTMSRSGLEKADVALLVLLNPCGDVREASFITSSRNRDVDRAAIQWARGARFVSELQKLGTLGRRGTLGRLPFSFSTE